MSAGLAPTEERFWECVDVRSEDECWNWTSSKNHNGYGNMRLDGRTVGSHRVSWMIHFGEIPAGMHICHRCDNPSCCNPSHLFLGTASDNARDKESKGRAWHVSGQHLTVAKLTWDEVRAIRNEYIPKVVGMCYLSEKYGVSKETIREILRGETWRE